MIIISNEACKAGNPMGRRQLRAKGRYGGRVTKDKLTCYTQLEGGKPHNKGRDYDRFQTHASSAAFS